jgi:hypothetical protein
MFGEFGTFTGFGTFGMFDHAEPSNAAHENPTSALEPFHRA